MSITELSRLFAQPNEELPEDVSAELQSLLRLHDLSEQELFFKWEAYSLKLGAENTLLDYKTVRDFKKDLQDALEREARGKVAIQSATKKTINATPRTAANSDVYGVLDGLVNGTPVPRTAPKRRNHYDTPSAKASKTLAGSSPHGTNASKLAEKAQTSFEDRPNAGQIIESLNSDLIPDISEPGQQIESRVKIKTSTDISKFNYRSMAMKLSEASEILDDRIDEFVALIQKEHGFPDAAFGNPAARSTSEIIAVGRIATDTEGSINAASLTLETSRRMGAGLRVPLKLENLAYDLFPGKIVALRGTNASGEAFRATEIISIPFLPLQTSTCGDMEALNARLGLTSSDSSSPLHIQIASGPYTQDGDLFFSALHELLSRATTAKPDVLILTGPFLDTEHPLVASGELSLPASYPVPADLQTLTDAFKHFISAPLSSFIRASPFTTVILVPSVRDAVLKHVSFPQDRLQRKELGLPKQVICVTNPITLQLNEIVVGITSQDPLSEMARQSVGQGHGGVGDDRLARLTGAIIEQRHFNPVFPPLGRETGARPTALTMADGVEASEVLEGVAGRRQATGAMLDLPYLKLGEWMSIRPDLLIVPSVMPPFAKVVENVVAVNPGSLSRKRAAGTFVDMRVLPRTIKEEERGREFVHHEVFGRARVDVVRI